MEEEDVNLRPKRQLIRSQKGRDYDEFLENEKGVGRRKKRRIRHTILNGGKCTRRQGNQ